MENATVLPLSLRLLDHLTNALHTRSYEAGGGAAIHYTDPQNFVES